MSTLNSKTRLIASVILLCTGITHIIQLWINCGSKKCGTMGAMVFGIIYLIEGLLLIWNWNKKSIVLFLYVLIIIINSVGCFLGVLRLMDFVIDQNIINGFIVWHLIADLFIVPLCAFNLCKLTLLASNKYDSNGTDLLNGQESITQTTQNGIEYE